MDPVTIFGLAGTILQFLDSGSQFVTLAWKFYQSKDAGSTLLDVQKITEDLDRILLDLLPPSQQRSNHEDRSQGLSELAKNCHAVAVELLNLLRGLNLSDDSRMRPSEALRTAFRVKWKEDEIKALQARLDTYRNHFNLYLLLSLQ